MQKVGVGPGDSNGVPLKLYKATKKHVVPGILILYIDRGIDVSPLDPPLRVPRGGVSNADAAKARFHSLWIHHSKCRLGK